MTGITIAPMTVQCSWSGYYLYLSSPKIIPLKMNIVEACLYSAHAIVVERALKLESPCLAQ